MFVKLAKSRGMRVIISGRRQAQVDRALDAGADHGVTTEIPEEAVAHIRALTDGRGVDVAIEAVGKPELWRAAAQMLRRGGTVNFFGGCPRGSEVSLPTELLHYSGLRTIASFHHTPATNRAALDHIIAGDVRARDFVGDERPLAALPDVLAALAKRNGVLKTAIVP
jgi:L-iditol 2-dehydrogenase